MKKTDTEKSYATNYNLNGNYAKDYCTSVNSAERKKKK
jgi:hypothetical protein